MPIGPDLLALGRTHMEVAHEMILVGARAWCAQRARRPAVPTPRRTGAAGVPGTRHAGRRGRSGRHPLRRLRLRLSGRQRGARGDPVRGRAEDAPVDAAPGGLAGARPGGDRCRHHRRHRRRGSMWLAAVPFAMAMLVGAAVAPTDAAAVAALLGRARLALPERITALLEVESGLNDPMSIFLTVLRHPRDCRAGRGHAGCPARCCSRDEMIGGGALGLGGGWLLALAAAPPVAGGTHRHGAGAGVRPGTVRPGAGSRHQRLPGDLPRRRGRRCDPHPRQQREIANFVEGFAWLAQIVLFLMLGLLVTPHDLVPFIPIGSRNRPGPDRGGAAGRDVRLPAAVPLPLAPVGVRVLGRPARRGADLYQLHPGAGRSTSST